MTSALHWFGTINTWYYLIKYFPTRWYTATLKYIQVFVCGCKRHHYKDVSTSTYPVAHRKIFHYLSKLICVYKFSYIISENIFLNMKVSPYIVFFVARFTCNTSATNRSTCYTIGHQPTHIPSNAFVHFRKYIRVRLYQSMLYEV